MDQYLNPAAVILMYHRISNISVEPNWLAVSPRNFADHLEHIQRNYHPMRLTDLAHAVKNNSVPRRAVVVTFDDGYLDNFTEALPLLESFRVPATVFVTVGHIGSPREFWWDELPRLVMLTPNVPPSLSLRIQSQDFFWRTVSAEDRQEAHLSLLALMKPLSAQIKDDILNQLCGWAGTERALREEYRTMTAKELKRFARSEYVELGAHTMTHPILPTLSSNMQRAEILNSRCELEAIIGKPIRTFAYPNGDFTDETAQLVAEAEFAAACSTIMGKVRAGDDLLRLRRCAVNDWGIELFKNNLQAFFGSN